MKHNDIKKTIEVIENKINKCKVDIKNKKYIYNSNTLYSRQIVRTDLDIVINKIKSNCINDICNYIYIKIIKKKMRRRFNNILYNEITNLQNESRYYDDTPCKPILKSINNNLFNIDDHHQINNLLHKLHRYNNKS